MRQNLPFHHEKEVALTLKYKAQYCMHVIDPSYSQSKFFPIDLSVQNKHWTHNDITDITVFKEYLNKKKQETGKCIAYGGYLEQRALYRNSSRFQEDETRDIHLGLDLWAPAGTSIHALLDGKIHSYAHNNDAGNYGPTLILEHTWKGQALYSLYGHLSIADMKHWKIGKVYHAGDIIAHLGEPSENGGYAPHLHLQLMRDMGHFKGDYPGVASADQVKQYQQNLIDPGSFLELY